MDSHIPAQRFDDDLSYAFRYHLREAKMADEYLHGPLLLQMGRAVIVSSRTLPIWVRLAKIYVALVGFNVFCGILLAEISLDKDIQELVDRHPYLKMVGIGLLYHTGLILLLVSGE